MTGWQEQFEDYIDGLREDILDRESDAKQFFDDLCDAQRDSYLDELSENENS